MLYIIYIYICNIFIKHVKDLAGRAQASPQHSPQPGPAPVQTVGLAVARAGG